MPALAAVLGWFWGVVVAVASWSWLAVVGAVGLAQITSAAARLIRITVALAMVVWAINAFLPPELVSFSAAWSAYSSELGPAAQYIGYFVPIDLLWGLVDMYVAAVVLLLVLSVIRRTLDFGK